MHRLQANERSSDCVRSSSVQRYEKLGLLGSGGAAVVYLVRQRSTRELFAMKVQQISGVEHARQVRS